MSTRTMLRQKIHDIDKRYLRKHAKYIAGLTDGEGCLMIRWNKRQPKLSFSCFMVIAMTHEEVIKRVADIFGVSHENVKVKQENRKTAYRLRVHTKAELEILLKELLPWLIVKKEQAEIILKFLNLEPKEGKRDYAKQTELYLRMRELNKRGNRFDLGKETNAILQRVENLGAR